MATMAESKALPDASASEHGDPREHLMLDPRSRGEMNAMVMESMHKTSKKFWAVVIFLVLTVSLTVVVMLNALELFNSDLTLMG